MKRIFVDMDGTLAVWNSGTPFEEVCSPGYFAGLAPQDEVVSAVKRILDQGGAEVFILSAVLSEYPWIIPDKNAWLDKHLPEIDRDHRVFACANAPKYIAVPGGVRAGDILLDDYTRNLLEWVSQPGAVGVKLLNGINHSHGTWDGPMVHMEDGTAAIVAALLTPVKEGKPDMGKEAEYNPDKIGRAINAILMMLHREYGKSEAVFDNLRRVPLAYSTTEDEEHEIRVFVDLISSRMISTVDDTIVEKIAYEDWEDLIADINFFDFDTAIADATDAWEKQKGDSNHD